MALVWPAVHVTKFDDLEFGRETRFLSETGDTLFETPCTLFLTAPEGAELVSPENVTLISLTRGMLNVHGAVDYFVADDAWGPMLRR